MELHEAVSEKFGNLNSSQREKHVLMDSDGLNREQGTVGISVVSVQPLYRTTAGTDFRE